MTIKRFIPMAAAMPTIDVNVRMHEARSPGRFFARTHAKAKTGDLYIYDTIGGYWGGILAKDVVKALEDMAGVKTLNIYINSPGGDVFEAVAMMSVIERFDGTKNVVVDGIAASAASFVAMVGDTITTSASAMWMIHEPWGFAMGSAAEMRKSAEMLDKINGNMVELYAERTGAKPADIKQWLADETWMTAAEAKERGFTDHVTDDEKASDGGDQAAAAYADVFATYKKTPERYRVPAPASSGDARLAAAEAYVMRLRPGASPGAGTRDGQPDRTAGRRV